MTRSPSLSSEVSSSSLPIARFTGELLRLSTELASFLVRFAVFVLYRLATRCRIAVPRIIRQQIGSWNYFNVSFNLPISDVLVAGKVPHVANVLKFAHCIASRNAMICSDLFYILFFFSILLVVAKLFYSEREFQGKYFLPLPQCCFYPTHLLVYFIICFLVAFCISVL